MTLDRRILAERLFDPDPLVREAAARQGIAICRDIRAEALRQLHGKLGSWQKVGDAVGLPRQDAWRMARN
jgi:hypothetical protein